MLVARRDPPFHTDADKAAPVNPNIYPPPRTSKFSRFVTICQMLGSLVAVAIGIASAYSYYRANFVPEGTCQTLRSGIIALLDKSVDAATRRMLVRRDVEEFEKTCATVDPDATAAFKTLLAAEKTAAPSAPPMPPVAPKAQRNDASPKEVSKEVSKEAVSKDAVPKETVSKEAAPKEVAPKEVVPKDSVRKVEPRPQAPAKPPASNAVTANADPVRRDSNVSDTQWLDAVRQALTVRKPEPLPTEAAKPRPATAPVARAVPQETLPPAPVPAAPPAPAASAPVVQPLAPALPRPITVMPSPGQRAEPDHPVPPESIPDSVPPASADKAKADEPTRSQVGKWISNIPLLGPVLDNGRR
jgi:hypothetical protein